MNHVYFDSLGLFVKFGSYTKNYMHFMSLAGQSGP